MEVGDLPRLSVGTVGKLASLILKHGSGCQRREKGPLRKRNKRRNGARCLPLAKAFFRTYARPALRKVFAAFPADTKVA